MRLFFALWPDTPIRLELLAVQQRWVPADARAHHPDDLHLTVHFLGEIAEPRIPELHRIGAALALPAMTLSLDRIGHWPGPQVLWLGPSSIPMGLLSLHRDLGDRLASIGLVPESRPYRPHITLARKVRKPVVGCLDTPLQWSPGTLALVGSCTDGRLPRYRVLHRYAA